MKGAVVMINRFLSYAKKVAKALANIVINHLTTNKVAETDLYYEDLSPKDDLNQVNSYTEALDWALSNEKVHNIALTGAYGSGKSSILKTYQKNRSDYYYLNISLASFDAIDIPKGDNLKDTVPNGTTGSFDDAKIEKSILQQLFYKVHPSQIPYTRFRKINNLDWWDILGNLLKVLAILLLGVLLFYPKVIYIIEDNLDVLRKNSLSGWAIALGYGFFCVFTVIEATTFIKYCNAKLRLSKISLDKTGIELSANEESIFNKYLDEILYFFEVTPYNVVLIEDLDRFKSTKIFTKLRELNSLINNSEQINRRVKFIYAVKDDMFKNRERTKFFDFIIPVIPVINATNSGDMLLKKIRHYDFEKKISDDYIRGVSIYVDDMRILNNIFNEFMIYKSALNNPTLKDQQMLSLIVYKNLYPSDFANLQYCKGMLHKVFEHKKIFALEKAKALSGSILKLKEKLMHINNEQLLNVRELKLALLCALVGGMQKIKAVKTSSNKTYSYEQILQDDFDISELDNIILYMDVGDYYTNTIQSSMKTADKSTGSKYTFIQRFEAIQLRSQEKQEETKIRIEELVNQQNNLYSSNLKDLIDDFGTEVLPKEVLNEKPIVYLLRHGFIDENYPNYLTYFYPNSINILELNFILSIRNHEACGFDYQLFNIKELVSRLNDYEFEQSEILNFDLLDFLLENKEEYVDKLDKVLKQLANESTISIKFIHEFFNKSNNQLTFIRLLCKNWTNVWSYLINSSGYSNSEIESYFKKILDYADLEDIKGINYDGMLKKYIENIECIPIANDQKIIEIITELDIKFNNLNVCEQKERLFDFIIENRHFKINAKMIETIFRLKMPKFVPILFTSNLTAIIRANYKPVLDYVRDYFNEYMENVFFPLETNTKEELDIILDILNNESLSKEIKEKVVCKESFILNDINMISEELWPIIFRENKLEINWNNIFIYFKNINKIDDVLIDFLNKEDVYLTLSLNEFLFGNNPEETTLSSNFSLQLINSFISYDAFSNLIKSIPYTYSDYDIERLSPEKIDLLMDSGILKFTVEIYNRLKEHFCGKHIRFIEKNYIKYLEEQDKYAIDNSDINELLDLPCFTEAQKVQLIAKIKAEGLTYEIVKKIFSLITEAKEKFQLNLELLNKAWTLLSRDDKLKLLVTQVEFMSVDLITEYLSMLGEPFSSITLPRRRQKIIYSDAVLDLAKVLKNSNYISSFAELGQETDRTIQFNTKIRA